MAVLSRLIWLTAALISTIYAKSSTGDSVLVVVEPKKQDNFNIFFNGLRDKGYELTFRAPRADSPVIIADDVPNFSHVILFSADEKSYAKDITPQSLVALLERKTNLIVALSTKQTPLSSLAAEFSLTPPPPGTPLISYFPNRPDPASVIPIPIPTSNSILTPNTNPIWYSGVPFSLGSNPLLVPILNAPAQAFASETDAGTPDSLVDAAEKGGEGLWAGSQLGVVTGFQPTSGARIVWTGSVEVFSDEFAQKEVSKGVISGNKQFSLDVASWAFQETSTLRIDRVEHHKVNETEPKEQYTLNDQLVYSVYISKFNPDKGTWQPYSDIKDLQLEFTMLDPFIRIALPPAKGTPGKYTVQFRAPDRHGVFKFVVNYKRKGWSHLFSSTTVPVVPPRHDGYPRFLSAAWPYYFGAISTSVGFLLFSAIWLAGEIREGKKGKTQKTE